MAPTVYPSVDYNDLFTCSDTIEHFARLDYELRSGVYIQEAHPEQQRLVWYLEDHFVPIKEFFLTVYGLRLQHRNDGARRFYFLQPTEQTANKIPQLYRKELKPELIISGLLLCQIVFVDLEIPNTLDELMNLLVLEYAPYREGLLRHVSRLKNSKFFATDLDDAKVTKWLSEAIDEFTKLGWVYKPGDGTFQVMPALDHLRDLYRNEIMKIETVYSSKPSN
jgi:hypothetical protein